MFLETTTFSRKAAQLIHRRGENNTLYHYLFCVTWPRQQAETDDFHLLTKSLMMHGFSFYCAFSCSITCSVFLQQNWNARASFFPQENCCATKEWLPETHTFIDCPVELALLKRSPRTHHWTFSWHKCQVLNTILKNKGLYLGRVPFYII